MVRHWRLPAEPVFLDAAVILHRGMWQVLIAFVELIEWTR
jgi:hypothetical protein